MPLLGGKRCFITGAASGIGLATARRFAREGAMVSLFDINAQGLEIATASLNVSADCALAFEGDVSREADIAQAIGATTAQWGGLDVCVGAAGIEPYDAGDTDAHELQLDVWQRTIDVNLTGMFLTCKHAVGAMLKSGGGSVIVTGSPTGAFGLAAGETAYSSSKAGCHGLARVMAAEYATRGIRVHIVVPGFIDTPINAGVVANPEAMRSLLSAIPMARMGTADEVAALNAWLASDESTYVTGGFIMVDGGQTAV
jgi:NAD(P)-dependent dehydrogenase (short-subunit alcohol dehydrogenase family)